jgi:hypothetical protein
VGGVPFGNFGVSNRGDWLIAVNKGLVGRENGFLYIERVVCIYDKLQGS